MLGSARSGVRGRAAAWRQHGGSGSDPYLAALAAPRRVAPARPRTPALQQSHTHATQRHATSSSSSQADPGGPQTPHTLAGGCLEAQCPAMPALCRPATPITLPRRSQAERATCAAWAGRQGTLESPAIVISTRGTPALQPRGASPGGPRLQDSRLTPGLGGGLAAIAAALDLTLGWRHDTLYAPCVAAKPGQARMTPLA